MKLGVFASLILSLSAMAAPNYVFDCEVAKLIDDNVFEEGLSRHEYPEVTLSYEKNKLVLDVGAMARYQEAKGDVIKLETSDGPRPYHSVTSHYKDDNRLIRVTVPTLANQEGRKWGKLHVLKRGEKTWTEVALLICK